MSCSQCKVSLRDGMFSHSSCGDHTCQDGNMEMSFEKPVDVEVLEVEHLTLQICKIHVVLQH